MFLDILKTKFLTTFKTGNHVMDMLISASIFTFIGKIAKSRRDIYYYLLKLFRRYILKKYNELNFYAIEHIKEGFVGNIIERKIYPTSILSLIYYINSHCNSSNDITSKREITKSGMNIVMKKNKYDFDNIEEEISSDLVIYSIDQDGYFKLSDKIYCEILTIEPEFDIRGRSNNRNNGYTRHITYRLFSNILSIHQLEQFVNNCVIKYKEYTKNLTRNNQYYLTFKEEDDNLMIFDEYKFTSNRSFKNIYFEQKDDLIEQLDFFINNKEWYDKHGIPHTIGLLFHGLPGCGKTSTIKAIANKTRRHIIEVPLSRIKTYQELMNIFHCEEINQKEIPIDQRIYVFEDFDCIANIVKKRKKDNSNKNLQTILEQDDKENIKGDFSVLKKDKNEKGDELTLSHILNVFDGLLEMPGRIIIITSNFPNDLDDALLRPGRIDKKVEFKKCTINIIKEIVSDFFSSCLNKRLFTEKESNIFDNHDNKYTPAEFIQICIKYKDSYNDLISYLSNVTYN